MTKIIKKNFHNFPAPGVSTMFVTGAVVSDFSDYEIFFHFPAFSNYAPHPPLDDTLDCIMEFQILFVYPTELSDIFCNSCRGFPSMVDKKNYRDIRLIGDDSIRSLGGILYFSFSMVSLFHLDNVKHFPLMSFPRCEVF